MGALLADPSILLLAEATSSLDSGSEAMIQEGLDVLRRGRTTFVIAHRLSNILSADRCLVLDGGRLVEEVTDDKLLRARRTVRDAVRTAAARRAEPVRERGEELQEQA